MLAAVDADQSAGGVVAERNPRSRIGHQNACGGKRDHLGADARDRAWQRDLVRLRVGHRDGDRVGEKRAGPSDDRPRVVRASEQMEALDRCGLVVSNEPAEVVRVVCDRRSHHVGDGHIGRGVHVEALGRESIQRRGAVAGHRDRAIGQNVVEQARALAERADRRKVADERIRQSAIDKARGFHARPCECSAERLRSGRREHRCATERRAVVLRGPRARADHVDVRRERERGGVGAWRDAHHERIGRRRERCACVDGGLHREKRTRPRAVARRIAAALVDVAHVAIGREQCRARARAEHRSNGPRRPGRFLLKTWRPVLTKPLRHALLPAGRYFRYAPFLNVVHGFQLVPCDETRKAARAL